MLKQVAPPDAPRRAGTFDSRRISAACRPHRSDGRGCPEWKRKYPASSAGQEASQLKSPPARAGLAGDGVELLAASAASGGSFLRFAGCPAGGTSPARQIRERHNCVPPISICRTCFPVRTFILIYPRFEDKIALFYYSVTFW